MNKNLLSLLLFISISFAARAQYVAIPDSNFGNWLYNNGGFSSCMTGNSQAGWNLDTTCSLAGSTTSISCEFSHIHNLTGIQYFRGLTNLDCANNTDQHPSFGFRPF